MGRHIATPAEICEELGIKEDTLRELRDSDRGFPWVQITPRTWGVPWVAFHIWLISEAAHNWPALGPWLTVAADVARTANHTPDVKGAS